MNITSINVNLMVALQALLAERSVTRAAARCGITQSSMSYSLSRLRELFDDPLLIRRAGALVPTPFALGIMGRLDGALADLQLVLEAKREFQPASSRRRFRISSSDLLFITVLPTLLQTFAKEAPRIELVIEPNSAHSLERLTSGALDVVIESSLRPDAAGLRSRTLLQEHYVCVARRRHPAISGRLSLKTFCALHHVLVASDEAPGLVDRALDAHGRSRHVALRISDYAGVGPIIANTDLIATVPTLVADVLQRTLPVQVLKVPFRLRSFGVCLYWHPRYDSDPGSAWLREKLFSVAEAHAAG